MINSEDFHDQVFRDFPDGFIAAFDNQNTDTRPVLHVYDFDVDPDSGDTPRISLDTAEDISGKVYDFTVTGYEIFDNEPTVAHLTIEGYPDMVWSDDLSDEMRQQLHNARLRGVDPSDEEDPPLSRKDTPPADDISVPDTTDIASKVLEAASTPDSPEKSVPITAEQADADPSLRVRAQIGQLLEGDS